MFRHLFLGGSQKTLKTSIGIDLAVSLATKTPFLGRFRVARRQGVLVLVDPRQDNVFGRLAIEIIEEKVFGLKEVRIFGVDEWQRLLREAGFSSAKIDTGPIWQPVAWAEAFIQATA